MVPRAPESASASIDSAIAGLARSHHGVVTRSQLRDLGLTDGGISARVRRGALHRRHQGVYAVGHTVLGSRGHWMAAVLACGPTAVLSHAAAGALWELRRSDTATVDVTVPGAGGRQRRPGIRVHRARSLDGQTTTRDGIPVTSLGRTIIDIAAAIDRRSIERLLDRAENARLGDAVPLDAMARALAGHRGAAKVLAVLRDHAPGTTHTRSDLEELFLALCRDAGLPKPRVNHPVAGFEADFVCPDERVLVETDSWRHHKSREAFERDRRRDAIHATAGWRTLRFTWRQIVDEPRTVAAALEAAVYLGASAASSVA